MRFPRADLWRFRVEGIDFLAADITNKEWGVVRSEARPGSEICLKTPHLFQAADLFHLAVGDPDPEESRILSVARIEIKVLTIARPTRVANCSQRLLGQIGPTPFSSVKQDELAGILGNGGDVLAFRRPARRKETLAVR